MKTLTAAAAAELDAYLMGPCKFSIDQLMELAGLAVAQAVYIHLTRQPWTLAPTLQSALSFGATSKMKILVICGPGNNGGDGLVAARHLSLMGFPVVVWYPKPSFEKAEIYERLVAQLKALGVQTHVGPAETSLGQFARHLRVADLVVDAIFGFSFEPGPDGEIRAPFKDIIREVVDSNRDVLSVDVPSGWDVEKGKPDAGEAGRFSPAAVISLTAPKAWADVANAQGWSGSHYLGGRFLNREIAARFGIEVPSYSGIQQVLELDREGKVIPP